MPNHQKHLGFALLFYVVILALNQFAMSTPLVSIVTLVLALPAYLIASLYPDVDIPTSKARRWTERVLLLTAVILILNGIGTKNNNYFYMAILPILFVFGLWFVKHRGFFHTWYMALILPIPLYFLGAPFYVMGVLGYLNHLVADALLHE